MTSTAHLRSTLPTLTPTARLIVTALAESNIPYTIANLCEITGGTPGHILVLVRKLVRRGLIVKTMNGTCSHLSIHPDLASPRAVQSV
jgi:hypothetical protein